MTQTRPEPKVIIIPANGGIAAGSGKEEKSPGSCILPCVYEKGEQLGSYENQKAYYTEKSWQIPTGRWRIS